MLRQVRLVFALSLQVSDGAAGVGGARRRGGIVGGGGHGGRAEQRAAGRRVLAKREINHQDGSCGSEVARHRRKMQDLATKFTQRVEEGGQPSDSGVKNSQDNVWLFWCCSRGLEDG